MTLRQRLRCIVESVDTPAGKAFDATILFLIFVSMALFAIETLPALSDHVRERLKMFEWITFGLFTAEYLLRLWVAEKPIKYATSFFGIVDLAAIAPALLFVGFDTRVLRSFRLLRLLRLLKLARYNKAIRRLHSALQLAWEELILFFFATTILLFIAAAGIYQFENEAQPEAFASIFHSLWWAITTLTTVGYGDVYPITTGGKAFTTLVLLIGLGIVAMPAGLVASALTKAREIEDEA